MSEFSIDIETNRVPERLSLLRGLFQRPTDALDSVARTMRERVLERFNTKTAPSGRKWAKWAPSTAAARIRPDAIHGTLLERTGALKRSFVARPEGTSSLRVGFSVSYAEFHEKGAPGMPARPLLTVDRGTRLSKRDSVAVSLAVERAVSAALARVLG